MKKTLAIVLALVAFGNVLNAQTKKVTKPSITLSTNAAPAGSSYTSLVTSWTYTPTAPACPTNGTLSNCIDGFNLSISLGGTVVFSTTAGYGTGQIGPTATSFTWTPTGGISFGNYTVTVTTVGYNGSGGQLTAAATGTLAVNLTSVNPPTNVTVTAQ